MHPPLVSLKVERFCTKGIPMLHAMSSLPFSQTAETRHLRSRPVPQFLVEFPSKKRLGENVSSRNSMKERAVKEYFLREFIQVLCKNDVCSVESCFLTLARARSFALK